MLRPLWRRDPFPTVSWVTQGLSLPKPQARALLRLFGPDLTVARRRGRMQRGQQPPRRIGDFRNRAVECGLIGLRGLVEAGKLAHELQRRGMDLILRRRRLEIEQRLDVAAHERLPCCAPQGRTED